MTAVMAPGEAQAIPPDSTLGEVDQLPAVASSSDVVTGNIVRRGSASKKPSVAAKNNLLLQLLAQSTGEPALSPSTISSIATMTPQKAIVVKVKAPVMEVMSSARGLSNDSYLFAVANGGTVNRSRVDSCSRRHREVHMSRMSSRSNSTQEEERIINDEDSLSIIDLQDLGSDDSLFELITGSVDKLVVAKEKNASHSDVCSSLDPTATVAGSHSEPSTAVPADDNAVLAQVQALLSSSFDLAELDSLLGIGLTGNDESAIDSIQRQLMQDTATSSSADGKTAMTHVITAAQLSAAPAPPCTSNLPSPPHSAAGDMKPALQNLDQRVLPNRQLSLQPQGLFIVVLFHSNESLSIYFHIF